MPTFTKEEWALIKGSSDLYVLSVLLDLRGTDLSFGWNHYGTKWSTGKRMPKEECKNGFHWSFGRTEQVAEKDGVQIGVKGENGHPYIGKYPPVQDSR